MHNSYLQPRKNTGRLWKILFLSFGGVAFKLVAGIRKLSNVRDCHLTLQEAPSIFGMWRYFFLAVQAVSCSLFSFLHGNPGI